MIPSVLTTCEYELRDGTVIENTEINWEGGISAIFFPIGVFFASAGILGLIDRRRAARVTAACVLICFAMVVVFFV